MNFVAARPSLAETLLAAVLATLTLVPNARAAASLKEGPRAFAFVAHAGEPLVVLRNALEGDWRQGKARALAGANKSALSEVKAARLDRTLRAWVGRPLKLYDDRGVVCDARVRDLRVWTRYEESVQDAQGKPDSQFDHDSLVARIHVTSGTCGSARWARDASLPAPLVFTLDRDPVLASIAEAAMRQVRALTAFAAIQKRYLAEAPAPKAIAWDRDQSASTQLRLYRHADGRAAYLSVAISAGQGCGEWGGSLWVHFEVGPHARLVRRSADAETAAYPSDVTSMLDLGDGHLGSLDTARLYRSGRAPTEQARTMEKPYFGCGC